MKLFSDILKNNKKSSSLLSEVQKKENSEYGVFVNITNDLSDLSENYELDNDPLILMAYAYARRSAAAGLYLQGLCGKDVFDYVQNIFLHCQHKTEQSKEFQIEAANQSGELLLSYSPLLTEISISILMGLVRSGNVDALQKNGKTCTVDQLFNMINTIYSEHEKNKIQDAIDIHKK